MTKFNVHTFRAQLGELISERRIERRTCPPWVAQAIERETKLLNELRDALAASIEED